MPFGRIRRPICLPNTDGRRKSASVLIALSIIQFYRNVKDLAGKPAISVMTAVSCNTRGARGVDAAGRFANRPYPRTTPILAGYGHCNRRGGSRTAPPANRSSRDAHRSGVVGDGRMQRSGLVKRSKDIDNIGIELSARTFVHDLQNRRLRHSGPIGPIRCHGIVYIGNTEDT